MKRPAFDDSEKLLMQKILVVQTAFIGDVILITPLIREIKRLFPISSIDVMVTPETSSILINNPNIDSLILFDKRKNKTSSFLSTLLEIKKKNYNIAFSPHSSITTALLLFLPAIPVRIGFARWLARKFLTHQVYNIGEFHKTEKNLRLLTPFTNQKFSKQTKVFPTSEMQAKAKGILSKLNKDSKKIIAVAPGSNWFTKRWPKEYYKNLVSRLSELKYGIVFIGGPEERNICEEVEPDNNYVNLAGELSLLESAAIISKCDLIICNDSGAMHLANAVKTDVIVFFGPTVKKIGYFPIREKDIVFEVDLNCRPCSSHGTKECPLSHHNCMHFIKSETVLAKVNEKYG